jgi:hypothetical protein
MSVNVKYMGVDKMTIVIQGLFPQAIMEKVKEKKEEALKNFTNVKMSLQGKELAYKGELSFRAVNLGTTEKPSIYPYVFIGENNIAWRFRDGKTLEGYNILVDLQAEYFFGYESQYQAYRDFLDILEDLDVKYTSIGISRADICFDFACNDFFLDINKVRANSSSIRRLFSDDSQRDDKEDYQDDEDDENYFEVQEAQREGKDTKHRLYGNGCYYQTLMIGLLSSGHQLSIYDKSTASRAKGQLWWYDKWGMPLKKIEKIVNTKKGQGEKISIEYPDIKVWRVEMRFSKRFFKKYKVETPQGFFENNHKLVRAFIKKTCYCDKKTQHGVKLHPFFAYIYNRAENRLFDTEVVNKATFPIADKKYHKLLSDHIRTMVGNFVSVAAKTGHPREDFHKFMDWFTDEVKQYASDPRKIAFVIQSFEKVEQKIQQYKDDYQNQLNMSFIGDDKVVDMNEYIRRHINIQEHL